MSEFFFDALPSPDATGSAEYRAILETLMDSTDDPDHAAAICDEFMAWARSTGEEIRRWKQNQECGG